MRYVPYLRVDGKFMNGMIGVKYASDSNENEPVKHSIHFKADMKDIVEFTSEELSELTTEIIDIQSKMAEIDSRINPVEEPPEEELPEENEEEIEP